MTTDLAKMCESILMAPFQKAELVAQTMHAASDEIDRLRAQVRRYEWLRSQMAGGNAGHADVYIRLVDDVDWGCATQIASADQLDGMIDKAMRGEGREP